MKGNSCSATSVRSRLSLLFLVFGMVLLFSSTALAFTVSLTAQGMPKKPAGAPQPPNVAIANFRWLIEEDTTHAVTPGTSDPNSLAFSFHKAHAPVVKSGDQTNAANITLPDGKRYFASILPTSGYTISGAPIADGQASVTVICNELPLPTAQITVFVFEDNSPINNVPDAAEPGLANFKVVLYEAGGRYGMSGGQQMLDGFGNMIGTDLSAEPRRHLCSGCRRQPDGRHAGPGVRAHRCHRQCRYQASLAGQVRHRGGPPGRRGLAADQHHRGHAHHRRLGQTGRTALLHRVRPGGPARLHRFCDDRSTTAPC